MERAAMEKEFPEIESQLLSIVRGFLSEVKTDRALSAVSIDASIDRDLGVDSLGRVELFLRIERHFSISLPESLMAEAEYLRDIAISLQDAKPVTKKMSHE